MEKIVLICHGPLGVKASPNTVVKQDSAKGQGSQNEMDLDIMEPGATTTIKLSALKAKMGGE